MKRCSLLAAPVMLLASFSPAADGIVVQVRDAVGGEDTDGTPNGFFLAGTGSRPEGTAEGGSFQTLHMGVFDLEANLGGGWFSMLTYCTEPISKLAFGLNPPDSTGGTFETQSLTSVGFSASEASFLQILWANAFANSLTDRVQAAAFQSILWEFAQDNSINLTAGMFALDSSDMHTEMVRSTAQTWLNNITGGVWTSSTPLEVLFSADFQDYLVPVIPGPGATALLMAATLLSARRRRRE